MSDGRRSKSCTDSREAMLFVSTGIAWGPLKDAPKRQEVKSDVQKAKRDIGIASSGE